MNEKILFIMAYPLDLNNRHLTQKFDGQIKAAENLGFNTWYTAYEKNKIFLCTNNHRIYIGKSIDASQNIFQCHFIYKYMKKIFKIQKFNICYIRSVPEIPSYLSALKTIKNEHCKVIVEIPTYRANPTERETRTRIVHSFLIGMLESLFGRKVPQYVDLYTIIGDDAKTYKGVKAINIQNGVDIGSFALKRRLHAKNELHLLALACMSYWHGYDRVIEGLKIYYSKPQSVKVYLHLVGKAGDNSLQRWKELVKKYYLEEYVLFEGFKSGYALDDAFNQADIALGSLGLYRKELKSASSIKIAEYCARGLPFIYAEKNDLLIDNLPFCVQVSNDNSVISITAIVKFAEKLQQEPDLQVQMRKYAENNMMWDKQLMKVLKLLNN